MSTIKSSIYNLFENFNLIAYEPSSLRSVNDIIIDGQECEEIVNATFEFDLKELQHRCSNGSLDDPFRNEHDYAAYQVLDPKVFPEIKKRYPNCYHLCYVQSQHKAFIHLYNDKNTRRAIIPFHDIYSGRHPCLTSIQFLIRENKLEVIANLRSWELSEWAIYDLALFRKIAWTMFIELHTVPNIEKLDLGTLTVHAASAHVVITC